MNLTNHLSSGTLALFALQLLTQEELDRAIRHLEGCEDCRHEVARFQGDLVGYGLSLSTLQAPSPQARERLMRRVGKEKKLAPPPPPVERPAMAPMPSIERSSTVIPIAMPAAQESGELFLASRGHRTAPAEPRPQATAHEEDEASAPHSRTAATPFLLWSGWALAAGLAVFAGQQFREKQTALEESNTLHLRVTSLTGSLSTAQTALDTLTDSGAMQVSLHLPVNGQPEGAKPEGHAAYIASKGALVFIANHLAPVDPDKTYELWLLPLDNSDPVPISIFRPDARGVASLVMPDMPKGLPAKGFGVTVEAAAGSKLPTPPIIIAGM
ncbi:MAG: anti-sigma factor [Acidobacteriaceae bacterium]|nr:anti-sigma factor [Acidobacteriaceae bacterium]